MGTSISAFAYIYKKKRCRNKSKTNKNYYLRVIVGKKVERREKKIIFLSRSYYTVTLKF